MNRGGCMNTSELQGAALDWAVGIAAGYMRLENGQWVVQLPAVGDGVSLPFAAGPRCTFSPSTRWAQGGPIIEQELNDLFKLHGRVGDPPVWCAAKHVHRDGHTALLSLTGPTPLVAAMRCFVASRLGDEVDIPEELK